MFKHRNKRNCKFLIIRYLLFVSFSILYSFSAFSQPISVPYFCGFEDAAENAKWIATGINGSLNKWTVGGAEKAIGDSSLYVSFDGGVTAGNNNTENFISVYRTFTLQAGRQYDIAFDWKNPGYGEGQLFVCWIPASVTIPTNRLAGLTKNYPKTTLVDIYSNLDNDPLLSGKPLVNAVTWQNRVFSVTGTGQPYKLFFMWVNTTESKRPGGKTLSSAACIDNVQISKKVDCPRPTNFHYTQIDASRGRFDWYGGAEKHEIKYKAANDTAAFMSVIVNNYDEYIPVRALKKGVYIAYIRSICETGDTSIWSVFPNILVHYSDNSCLDFVNLHSPVVEAWTGLNQKSTEEPQWQTSGVIDYGYASFRSRHTIHYDMNDYDARTNYQLRAVPPDGMPSLRVGTWDLRSHYTNGMAGPGFADAITYTYHVSGDAPLLLMKYAIVLEYAPEGHAPENQARFVLRITDERDNNIDTLICGQASFLAYENMAGWHRGEGGAEYKEWTSIGLNLQRFVGKTIKISVLAMGCAQSGHYGYGYFSMDCMGAKIAGIGCSDYMFGKLEAPEGFRYQWYPKGENIDSILAANPLYADTMKTFMPLLGADDNGTYVCRLIAKEDASCWFELEARLDPRDVYAEIKPELKFDNCRAFVTMNNTSHTLTRTGQERGVIEEHTWDLGDGRVSYEPNPTIEYSKPGTYTIKYTAGISEGLCTDYTEYKITVPKFGNTRDTVNAQICDGATYEFDGKIFNTNINYRPYSYKSMAGCDSIVVLNLKVIPAMKRDYSASITSDEKYSFYGQMLNETGVYIHNVPKENSNSCDSIITLDLTVYPALHVSFNDGAIGEICEDNTEFTLYYNIDNGTLQSYDLIFSQKAIDDGFQNLIGQTNISGEIYFAMPDSMRPNNYEATFIGYGGYGGNDTIHFVIPVYYSDKVIQQKWNDVLAVTNSRYNGRYYSDGSYNGGYVFSAFEWYKNGEQIIGENGSYMYIENGTLDFTAEYRARLTRADDGFTTFTCAFVPTLRVYSVPSEIIVFPTIVDAGMFVNIISPSDVTATFVDMLGNMYNSVQALADVETQITAPVRTGLYFLEIESEKEGKRSFKILVK